MAFQLKGNRKETENKTIRFPIHLIDQIEQAISDSDQDITFSSFVIQAWRMRQSFRNGILDTFMKMRKWKRCLCVCKMRLWS